MATRAMTRRGAEGGGATAAGGSGGATAASEHTPVGSAEDRHDDDDVDDNGAPSELLGPLLEEWRDVLVKHVLTRLDPTAPCSRGWRSRGWRWWWPTTCHARGWGVVSV
jgi:hypothetical protein